MSPHLHSSVTLMLMARLVGVSMQMLPGVFTSGQLLSQPLRGHGDPCGGRTEADLVCCIGVQRSTLLRAEEQCCNGRLVRENEICCDDLMPVAKASPSHDACCLHIDVLTGTTYDSSHQYCNPETGHVHQVPLSNFLARAELSDTGDLLRLSPSSSYRAAPRIRPPLLPSMAFASSGLSSDSLEDVLAAQSLCQNEVEESPSQWPGEPTRCCGGVTYLPSRQTCCRVFLHDLPSAESQCCYDQAFQLGDASNPCIQRCGSRNNLFNSETQLCCQGVVHNVTSRHDRCCGRDKISTKTHVCCSGSVSLSRRGAHSCCMRTFPYVRRFMSCRRVRSRSGPAIRVERKPEAEFCTDTLCRRTLPEWGSTWPAPPHLEGQTPMIQVEGHVSSVKKDQRHEVHLTLTSFRIVQSASREELRPENFTCLESDTLRVVAHLNSTVMCGQRQLRHYLSEASLTVFSPLSSFSCEDGHGSILPVLQIPACSSEHLILKSHPIV